ncbi:NADH:ubiquinone reductase (H(+)-translocating) [Handroanthus impetiginosus]|uniref:NADH:ubiquinone reductase (H(+)-translocating) n=1 Tax=Handroanthus impetiginosus TaxID=429701 RepID=A0A2G9HKV9_9LAMI|nr:NADH:ubiquinone reductase (H(+)-translocating) [Handroanthus impetiginosus]
MVCHKLLIIYGYRTVRVFNTNLNRRAATSFIRFVCALAKTNPILAITFSITMFLYAGIPPLADFCSKFYLFFAALGCRAYFLAPVGVVTSIIGHWAVWNRFTRSGGSYFILVLLEV